MQKSNLRYAVQRIMALTDVWHLVRRFEDRKMSAQYTAVVQRDGTWWIGWVQEIPGVNSQGATREELLENLQSALEEAIQMNRQESLAAASADHEEVSIQA